MRGFALFTCLMMGAWAQGAKAQHTPFYLTIERSYAPSETPEIRFDYTDTSPVRLTVLRPVNLETFLEGQLAISRSYEEPLAALNPGHYLLKGLNKVTSPLARLRFAIDGDVRKGLMDTFGSPLLPSTNLRVASVPKEVSIGAPKGFTVEREFFIDLQAEDPAKANLVPGFEAYSDWGGSTSYRQRVVPLEPLADGVYLVQAVQGAHEAQALLQVSRFSVQLKQSSDQLVARVVDRDAAPVAGAALAWRDRQGRWRAVSGKTDDAGELIYRHARDGAEDPGELPGRLVVRVTKGDVASVLVDTDFLPALAEDRALYLMTDRPIFKPGEDVQFKGYMRRDTEAGPAPAGSGGGEKPQVALLNQDGTVSAEGADVRSSAFDTFSGAFALDPDSKPGLYQVVARVAGTPYSGELRVRDYVKPTFYLEMSDVQGALRPGVPFSFKIRAKRYSGGAPAGARYDVFVYRKKYSQPAFVEDAGKGLATGTNYQGASQTGPSHPEKLFSTLDARQTGRDPWETASLLDSDGSASVKVELPADAAGNADDEWIYTLIVSARDGEGAFATLSEDYYATSTEIVAAASFAAPVGVASSAGTGELAVMVTYPDGRVAPDAAGHAAFTLQQVGKDPERLLDVSFVADSSGRALVKTPEIAASGRLTATVSVASYGGKPLKKPAVAPPVAMIVADKDGGAVVDTLGLEAYATSEVVETSGRTSVLLLLPKGWGRGDKGTIWRTTAGAKVHATQAIQAEGQSVWIDVEGRPELGTGFYETFTVATAGGKFSEQTVGFRQIRKDRVLTLDVRPGQEIVGPGEEQTLTVEVKDAAGRPAADTELTIGVIDRAVYAVQPEMRPSIFDFFYPLPRLNVMTFYSDELQGYGYADEIRRPNFRLGALKAEARDQRDTAAWFPHVVTDAQGLATVRFKMPGNLTEWLVTVTAMDVDGRIGETRRRFRSGAENGAFPRLAKFLREGDRLEVPVRLANDGTEDKTATVRLASAAGVDLIGDAARVTTVPAKSESTVLFEIKATAATDQVRVTSNATFDGVAKDVAETVRLMPAAMIQRFASAPTTDGEMSTGLPAAGTVEQARVNVSVGLLGAALAAGAELAVYPYGCTEQLTHSTVPNLVLMDILKRANVDEAKLGPYATLFKDAERNAASGIQRLLASQHANGAFGSWPGDPMVHAGTTIIAMYGLKIAADLGNAQAKVGYAKAAQWLTTSGREAVSGLAGEGRQASYLMTSLVSAGVTIGVPVDRYLHALSKIETPSLETLAAGLKVLREARASHVQLTIGDTADLEKSLVARLQAALMSFDPAAYDAKSATFDDEGPLDYDSGSPAAIALAAGALREADALPKELAEKTRDWLLAGMNDNAFWLSTFTTAQVLYNARSLLEDESKNLQAAKGVITIALADDSVLGELVPVPGGYAAEFTELAKNAALFPKLTLSNLPSGARASAVLRVSVPNKNVVAKDGGILVERGFVRVGPKGGEPLANLGDLRVGDVVISLVKVTRPTHTKGRIPSRLVVVEDPIPSLGEAIDDDRKYLADIGIDAKSPNTYWAKVKQTYRYPDRTVRIAELRPGHALTLYSAWRVAFAGEAAVNGATAFDMYDERASGNTGAETAKALSLAAAKP